jgi:hypothetical protein
MSADLATRVQYMQDVIRDCSLPFTYWKQDIVEQTLLNFTFCRGIECTVPQGQVQHLGAE